MSQKPYLAPASELVRYLAVFQRALAAIEEYTHNDDKPGMLLGGYLANALHNVPALLWHYSEKGLHTSAQTDAYLQGFPEQMQRCGAPERLVEASRQIVSGTGTTQELGLQEDLADLGIGSFAEDAGISGSFALRVPVHTLHAQLWQSSS